MINRLLIQGGARRPSQDQHPRKNQVPRLRIEGITNRRLYYLSLAIIFVAILLHQPLLVVVGLLILVVTGTTDIWARYCLQDLYYRRQFSEQRALFGEEITLSLSIENAKLLPLPWLETEDSVPRSLIFPKGDIHVSIRSNAAVLENLFSPRWYERITRRYTIRCTARGIHTFGPTTLRSGDVFGFLSREVALPNWQYLLVYPLVVPLTRFGLPARHPFGDYRAPRRLLEDPSRVIGVRDYIYGDELRRIHWKATARTMQMQSKIYEPTTTYTLVLFLNVVSQLDAYYGINPQVQELCICATASVAHWAVDQGYAVGLYANTIMYMPEVGLSADAGEGEDHSQEGGAQEEKAQVPGQGLKAALEAQLKRRRIHLPPASSEEQRKRIMEVLARIQSYFGSTIEDVILTERTRLPAGATVVVVTSTIGDLLLDALARVRQSGHAVTILYAGDTPLPTRLAGVTIYHIGGEDTWKDLEASYRNPELESSSPVPYPAGFRF
jgi:uncharacterized protein (DUF58 family)